MNKLFFLLALVWFTTLQAEILTVVVRWRERSCRDNCVKLLETELKGVKEIETQTVSLATGTATLKWKKNYGFSYKIIKRPFQMVGVGIYDFAISVRGRIQVSKERVVLISDGDNTSFDLVSYRPEQPAGKYLKLDVNILKVIEENSKEPHTFIVEGTLYQPHKEPPLYLLVEKIHVEEVKTAE